MKSLRSLNASQTRDFWPVKLSSSGFFSFIWTFFSHSFKLKSVFSADSFCSERTAGGHSGPPPPSYRGSEEARLSFLCRTHRRGGQAGPADGLRAGVQRRVLGLVQDGVHAERLLAVHRHHGGGGAGGSRWFVLVRLRAGPVRQRLGPGEESCSGPPAGLLPPSASCDGEAPASCSIRDSGRPPLVGPRPALCSSAPITLRKHALGPL